MRRLALACLLALPLALLGQIGCTDQACIQWSEAEGACPSKDDAIKYMVSASDCNGAGVVSVDSEGEFDGRACCYDVTNREEDQPIACGTSVGVSAAGPGAVTAVTSGTGGVGAAPSCDGPSCVPECFPPTTTATNSCVLVDNVNILCDPVTDPFNSGCDPSFETCDLFFDGSKFGFGCWPSSFVSTCSSCTAFGQCLPGNSCVGSCAKFCCEDADCAPGGCFKDQYAAMGLTVGVCVDASVATGGAGGQGGAGGAGGGQGGAGGI